jgi:uncharacterized protein
MIARLPRRALALLALCALFAGPARADAQESSCTGSDLISELKEKDPKAYAALIREEKKVIHGEGLLFRMEKKGAPAIHVFGTIHVDDPRFKKLPQQLVDALEAADIVATEIEEGELSNPVTMLKMAALAANPKADTLTRLKPSSRKAVEAALEARGLPTGAATRMDAGFLLLSLALPPCAILRDAEKLLSQESGPRRKILRRAEYRAGNRHRPDWRHQEHVGGQQVCAAERKRSRR